MFAGVVLNMGRKRKSVESHVAADDYFGTLASILELLRQDVGKLGRQRAHKELLGRLRDDLLHLQRNYKIKSKGNGK